MRHVATGAMIGIWLLTAGGVLGCQGSDGDRSSATSDDSRHDNMDDQSTPEASRELDVDFGYVAPRQVSSHQFRILNDSNISWTPKSVKASCLCTVPRVPMRPVNPSKVLPIDVTYTAPQSAGADERSIRILFSEEGAPSLNLKVKSIVIEPMMLSTDRLDLGRISSESRSEPMKSTIVVTNYTGRIIKKLMTEDSNEWLNCNIVDSRVSTDQKRPNAPSVIQNWIVEVNVLPALLRDGRNDGTLTFVCTDDGVSLRKELSVTVYNAPAISASPSLLFFGEIQRRATVVKSTQLVFAGSSDVERADIEVDCTSRYLRKVDLERMGRNRFKLVVEATVSGDAEFLKEDLEVVLRRRHGERAVLRIPDRSRSTKLPNHP